MKSNKLINLILIVLGLSFGLTSCFKDLDTIPLDEDEVTSAVVYNDNDSYKRVLAKLYAGLAVSGQEGPAGQPDILGIDEGFSTYLRQYWKAQELSTDEAVVAWNDGNIHDFHQQDWDANNEFITAMYNRIFYQISLCNEFIRETTDEKLDSRGTDAALKAEIATYRAEARFLRALSYYHALDMFRNVPFVTEGDAVGAFFPEQTNAEDLFNYIESELKAIENDLMPPQANEYARADQAAAWTLLAKLFLNSEIYTGKERYADCVTYSEKIINAGYELEPSYQNLFVADNNKANGVIFPVAFDGIRTQTYGGMVFLIHAAVGGSMDPAAFGIDGGWGGIRTTSALVEKFPVVGSGEPVVVPNPGNTYPVIYVPGDYQETVYGFGGWDPTNTTTVLASVNDNGIYEGYKYFLEGSQFKFTPEPVWDLAYGDTDGDGILDSDNAPNFTIDEEGMYRLTVNLNDLSYSIEKMDWGLIGDATPGGWDTDTNMAWDSDEKALVLQLDLTAGSIKFRANDGWDVNLGDPELDGLLGYGDDNIGITSAGNYLIKLYLDRPDYTYSVELTSFDSRALFYTDGQSLDIEDIAQFTDGYAITKYKNLNSDGTNASDLAFVDTDYPLFRLADVYLMYAEAVLRGGGGDMSTAVDLVNAIRGRAYNGASGNISASDLTLDFILDERARELYWEGQRRTDLIRFGKFSSTDYLWPWKGGVPEGVSTDSHFDVFPIPATDIGANPNLEQNSGY